MDLLVFMPIAIQEQSKTAFTIYCFWCSHTGNLLTWLLCSEQKSLHIYLDSFNN